MMQSKALTAVLVVAVILASFWLGTVWDGNAPSGNKVTGTSKAGADPSTGPDGAKVKIIEYSDFQCPYCSRAAQTMKQVVEIYGEQVQLTFRNFPLSFHQYAQKAAEASECANLQGKFWEMHDKMFANQNALTDAHLKAYAVELGMDADKFNSCLDSGEMKAEVERDFQDGTALGVQGTPGFIINGEHISGALPLAQFQEIIDKKLAES
jgi:protein-disulfide isomerase